MTLGERRAAAIAKYREISNEILSHALDTDEEGEALQAMFEALAHELGFVEGYVIMLGVETEDRDRSKSTARHVGLRECLADHDKDCSGCPAGDALRRIVEAN